jgi:Fe-S cluster biogenesis protein NfuA
MFIETETTPNPATLKFLPGREVLAGHTANFTSAEEAEASPLAARLFQMPEVAGVFFGADFITVTKADGDWSHLKPEIMGIIMDQFLSGQPLVTGRLPEAGEAANLEDEEIIAQIKTLLETRVRPAVARDGGDIIFQGFQDGVVYLHMQGSCSGCPSSSMTLKHGIENLLKHFVPEVRSVEPV